MNEVKKAPVLITTEAIETFETLIAKKKVIQCSEIKILDEKNFNKEILSNANDLFFNTK